MGHLEKEDDEEEDEEKEEEAKEEDEEKEEEAKEEEEEEEGEEDEEKSACDKVKELKAEHEALDPGNPEEYEKYMDKYDALQEEMDECREETGEAAQEEAEEEYEEKDLTKPMAAHDHDTAEGMQDGDAAAATAKNVEKEGDAIDKTGFEATGNKTAT